MRGVAHRITLLTRTLCNTVFQARRNSLVCFKDIPRATFDMAAHTTVVVGTISSSRMNIHTYSRGQGTHSFAAASLTGCLNPATKHTWTVRILKPSISQLYPALLAQPSFGCLCITTSALKERLSQPLYRKRRKKGRGKGSQSSALPARVTAQAVSAAPEKSVVVVESPAKARTIEKYLGQRHVVLPSFGHVRDLAAKSGSVRPEEDFKLVWEVPSSARQHLNAIKAAVKGASNLFLASDPDREGEAIAWHVLEMLKTEGAVSKNLKVSRVVFNEITKAAVLRAMEAPRDISATLVDAYLARRALDYLIGFDLSPVLWRKLPGSKSAGRVQSAALRLVCEREQEMEAFAAKEYWTIDTELSLRDKEMRLRSSADNSQGKRKAFPAKVTHVDGEKLSQFSVTSCEQAQAIAQRVEMAKLSVCSVKKSVVRRNPLAPYITSTLQQDASTKLGFGASRTMALAQQLYEGVKLGSGELTGLITYMRTDGVQLSSEAVQDIRTLIVKRYGDDYVPQQPRQFTSRVKNAQEAHEAIRPTDINRLPSMLVNILEEDSLRLYSLIWCRTVSCQMEPTIYAQVAVDIMNETEDLQLRATGSSISFPGFLTAFKDKGALVVSTEDGIDDGGEAHVGGEDLRSLEAGDLLSLNKVLSNQHFTEPPPRYTEASLVKKMEDLGIGRPSTYASTIRTLQSRNYVRIEKRRIFPEGRGRMVSAFLSYYFPRFSDYDFTAKLETQLDDVSAGRAEWKNVLNNFWPEFHEGVSTVLKIPIEEVVNLLENAFAEQFFSGSIDRLCPSCNEGKMGLKLSRFGSGYFLGCSRYPHCMYKTNVLSADGADSSDEEEAAPKATTTLGVDPLTGLEVVLKSGPYGRYVQMGSVSKKQKPKRTAIPKDMNADEMTLEVAIELLKYPFELGTHPETNAPIVIGTGQYGPFLRCKAVFVSVPKESIPTLTVEQAVALLASKHVSKRGRKGKSQDETPSKDDGTPTDQPKDSKSGATKAKGRATSSAKKSASVTADNAEKVKVQAPDENKPGDKVAEDAKEEKSDKRAGNSKAMEKKSEKVAVSAKGKDKKSDKLDGNAKSKEKATAKSAETAKKVAQVKGNGAGNATAKSVETAKKVAQVKGNGAGNVKRGPGRPRNASTNTGEVLLAAAEGR
ncbi:unnamed protein product [Calypogeia fissa]